MPVQLVPATTEVQSQDVELPTAGAVCTSCQMYKSQLLSAKSELKEKADHVERLRQDLNSQRAQLKNAHKVGSSAQQLAIRAKVDQP